MNAPSHKSLRNLIAAVDAAVNALWIAQQAFGLGRNHLVTRARKRLEAAADICEAEMEVNQPTEGQHADRN